MGRRQTIDPRLRAEVIERWGDSCWLNMPGCTRKGEEDDHIVPFSHGGLDTVTNLRRACKHCNAMRQDRVLSGYGATLHALIGPPRADFTGYLAGRIGRDGIVVSFDSLVRDIYPWPEPPEAARQAAAMAWDGAYRSLARCGQPVDVWLVRTLPVTRRHPNMLGEWQALDYDVHVLDVPPDTTFGQPLTPGEERTARRWYALGISQRLVDARRAQRRERLERLGLRTPTASPARAAW